MKLFEVLPLLLTLLKHVQSCEQYPCNVRIDDTANSHKKRLTKHTHTQVDICGDSLQCKYNVAGGAYCHDRSQCNQTGLGTDWYCSDDEVAYRAGNKCHEW